VKLDRWKVWPFLTLCCLFVPLATVSAETQRPNVIIVLVDDFGWGDPSCYGNEMVQTIHLDRMGAEGIRFTQGYVASPICSPSRCGILTGQFPARWRITSYLQTRAGNQACEMADFLDPQCVSLPRVLKEAGYRTAHIGKWHLGGGRDVVDAPRFAAYGYDLGLGTYESPEPAAALGLKSVPWGPQSELEPQQVPRHDRSRWMIDQALQFARESDKPFIINLWLDDTHTPFVPSQEQINFVKREGEGERKTNYRAILTNLDRELGRLMDGLRGTNTLVVLLGDNGASPPLERERSGGLRGQKLSLYEGGIRVPFLVWWANRKDLGSVDDQTVLASIDLLPSLATLCGAKLPAGFVPDGTDMSRAMQGTPEVRSKPLYWEYGRNPTSFAYPKDLLHKSPNLALRDGEWKLLVNDRGDEVELYNLLQDRSETINVAPEHPERREQLKAKLLQWRKSLP
jgi:arylsulfatase A-like enzyme